MSLQSDRFKSNLMPEVTNLRQFFLLFTAPRVRATSKVWEQERAADPGDTQRAFVLNSLENQ